jgi:hypothetical protein
VLVITPFEPKMISDSPVLLSGAGSSLPAVGVPATTSG